MAIFFFVQALMCVTLWVCCIKNTTGFCRVGQGKKHIAAYSLIPRNWRLHCLWCMLQMLNQVWSGLLYRGLLLDVWVANFS